MSALSKEITILLSGYEFISGTCLDAAGHLLECRLARTRLLSNILNSNMVYCMHFRLSLLILVASRMIYIHVEPCFYINLKSY